MDYKLDKVWLLDSHIHIHNLLLELMLLPQVHQADPQLMEQLQSRPHHIHLHGGILHDGAHRDGVLRDDVPHGGVLRDGVLHGGVLHGDVLRRIHFDYSSYSNLPLSLHIVLLLYCMHLSGRTFGQIRD
jgi:hypothetical protein